MDQQQIIIIAAVVAAILLIGLILMVTMRNKKTTEVRDRFGHEYERTVSSTGSKTKAEAELRAREKEVRQLPIEPLSASDRDRFHRDWQRIEARFVDRPTTAVLEAEELISEVMRARGFSVGNFDTHAKEISVSHPGLVDDYRKAHGITVARESGPPSTEDLRQAMVRYRGVFDKLTSEVRRDDDVPRDTLETSGRREELVDERDREVRRDRIEDDRRPG